MAPINKLNPPLYHYAVIGRHHGDDEDQCVIVASESMERASSAFREAIDRSSPNKAGREIYISHTICSETPLSDSDSDLQAMAQIQDPYLANTLIDAARQHGQDGESDHEVGDLQDLVRAMWKIMTPSQRVATLRANEVQNIAETVLDTQFPADLDDVSDKEVSEALAALGLDPSREYSERIKIDAVAHMRVMPQARHQYAHSEGWGHIFSGSTETTTRWAAEVKTQTIIDAQYLTATGWQPLDQASILDLLESIKDNDAFSAGPGGDLDVKFSPDVSGLPDWVNAPPTDIQRERQGA